MRRFLRCAPQPFLPLIVSALLLAAGNPVWAQDRHVDTEVALSHLINKVDAVVPDEARAKKIGGPVIADVTIGVEGKVLSLTIRAAPSCFGRKLKGRSGNGASSPSR